MSTEPRAELTLRGLILGVLITVVFTAANGDQLFMDVIGLPTTTASISGTYTFTGGTGRFGNASGGADFVGVIAPDGIHITVAFEGTIQY